MLLLSLYFSFLISVLLGLFYCLLLWISVCESGADGFFFHVELYHKYRRQTRITFWHFSDENAKRVLDEAFCIISDEVTETIQLD